LHKLGFIQLANHSMTEEKAALAAFFFIKFLNGSLNMKPILFVLLFVAVFAQAQLVPPGMVLPSAEADSTVAADSVAPTPVVEQPAPENMVELYDPANPDSLKYYDVEIFRNQQEETHKHSIANVLNVIALSGGLIGLGIYGSSYLVDDNGKADALRYAGGGVLLGALVSAGFAFGFDVSSEGYRIKAQYYIQKRADYQKRHSALEVER